MNKIATLFIGILLISFLEMSCSRKAVELPNGYTLAPVDGKIAYLKKRDGAIVLKSQVTQFCVGVNCVYGWQDDAQESFFYVNTLNNELKTFGSWRSIDEYLIHQGLPRLQMNESYTYWDILSGHKKKNW
jgi:hypothetical protein